MGEPSRNLSVNDVEVHTYSVGLLSQLQFMQQFADCYDNLKGHKVRSEQCQNTLNLGGLFSQIILSVYINLWGIAFRFTGREEGCQPEVSESVCYSTPDGPVCEITYVCR